VTRSSALSAASIASYSLGSFGTGVFSTVPTVLLLYYCTQILQIDPAWAAAIVFVPKAWAVLWDPLIGAWSDRTTGRFGRRRPFLVLGVIGVPLCFVAVFHVPKGLPVDAAAVWVAVAYFALATFYSVFAVPYVSVPGELAISSNDRSRLVAWRMTVAMIGVLAGGGIAPWLVALAGGGRPGYTAMALALGLTCAVAMVQPLFMLRAHDQARSQASDARDSGSWWHQLRVGLRTEGFLRLAISYLLLLTAVGAFTSAVPYLITQSLGRTEAAIGTAMGMLLLATTFSISLWSRAGRMLGDGRMLATGAVAFGAAAAAIGWSAGSEPSWLMVLVLFSAAGLPLAAVQVLPFTLLAHLIHEHTAAPGNTAGLLTGAWTAIEKLGLALGPALTALALAAGEPRSIIPVFIAIVPASLSLAALVPMLSPKAARAAEGS
jgi:glycoside/pentoside/hexuronide:cation symporter, GPH family